MNESLKILIIAVLGLLAVCLCWFLFMYRPEIVKLRNLKSETGQLLARIQSLRVTDAQVDDLEKGVEQLQKEIAKKQAGLLLKEDLHSAVQQIQKHGKRYGVKLQKIIPDYDKLIATTEESQVAEAAMALTLHLKLRSKYKNFGRFLEKLDDLPFLISVGELTLGYDEQSFPELVALLDVQVFLRSEDAALKAVL